jgi:hypothetical protein
MKTVFVSAISALAHIVIVAARRPGLLAPPLEAGDEFAIEAAGAVDTTGNAFFTQLLDHDNPSKGTFQQKYWWNYQYWEGPGSPVSLHIWILEFNADCSKKIVFFTPGEIAAAAYGAYLTNVTLTGYLAQELKGAVVMIERKQRVSYSGSVC